MKPLAGIRVVDFSQFLAGPACSLRLADLGAEVIKVERPGVGDICRKLYVAKQKVGDESTIFHAINRNKKSVALDLKNDADRQRLFTLIESADVVIQNFRPGVAKRLGIDYESLKTIKPKLVYGSVSGYSQTPGPWFNKPGQDLLAQSLSGLVWRNVSSEQPVPMGLAIADLMAAYELTQGILALLVRRGIQGIGGLTEVSLLESLIGIQSTALTADLNAQLVKNTGNEIVNGIYPTANGLIAIGSCPLQTIISALDLDENFHPEQLPELIESQNTAHWQELLRSAGIAAEELVNWHTLRASEHYRSLKFEQTVFDSQKRQLHTTRCPITIDGQPYYSSTGAPAVGEHNSTFWEN